MATKLSEDATPKRRPAVKAAAGTASSKKSDTPKTKRRIADKDATTKAAADSNVAEAKAPAKRATKAVAKAAAKTDAKITEKAAEKTPTRAPKGSRSLKAAAATPAEKPKRARRASAKVGEAAVVKAEESAVVAPAAEDAVAKATPEPAVAEVSAKDSIETENPAEPIKPAAAASDSTVTVEALAAALAGTQRPKRSKRAAFGQTFVPFVLALGLGFVGGAVSNVDLEWPSQTTSSSKPAVVVGELTPTSALPTVAVPATEVAGPEAVAPVEATPAAPGVAPDTGQEVLVLTGNSSRQSAPFTLEGGSSTVAVTSDGGSATVRLLQLNTTGPGDIAADCQSACSLSTTLEKAPGQYFIDVVSSSGNWAVRVTQ